ncbi:GNAT family N-acetyltransferase [Aquirufa ecclesiirivi]|uniref:GNAT family N-acetyltransferase n=1 Tax=Aquirufa ecclesiirivi TaxID=2715124 RepID=UPI001409E5E4|nr:GNAT family protein [Aquirufa ecclesiirivi]NHC48136.1 GNAT family N-acetyltransferase [Aquirufa ecclesiirivi]
MVFPTKIESERLKLIPLSLKQLSEEYVCWMNNSIVNEYLESGGNYTLELLELYLKTVEEKSIFFYAIILKANNKHIGNIKIDPINYKHGFAEYGIMMGDINEWGKGYAFEASNLVIKYCFEELKLRKICLGVISENIAAVNLYKKLGFIIEGIYKEHFLYKGDYCSCIRMAIFNPKRIK